MLCYFYFKVKNPAEDDAIEDFVNDLKLVDKELIELYKSEKLLRSEVDNKDRVKQYKTFKNNHCSEGPYAFQVSMRISSTTKKYMTDDTSLSLIKTQFSCLNEYIINPHFFFAVYLLK